jgi:glycine/D-amino acid oxidase-like deaminating enzyme
MTDLPDAEKSFWREYYHDIQYPELGEDIEVDVAIVGAGIAGLTAGYLLKQRGFTVAVLEKDTIGSGTTGRTTGKVTSQHNLTYHGLEKRLGEKAARIYGESNQAAVEQVSEIIEAEKIACDWQWEDNYIFTTSPDKVEQIKLEAQAAANAGLPATFETSVPLPFEVKGAVKFTRQGKFNSQKYLLGLAGAINGNGSHVYEHSKAVGIREGNPCRVKTSKASVLSKHIIVASKVPTFPLVARVGYAILEYPTESFSIACRLDKEVQGMYISPDKGHHSILPMDVDGERTLIIVGAGGNIPGIRLSKEARYKRLADYASEHFDITAITNKWSDMDYLPYDNVPLIGKLYPWSKNLYTASGFLKWGLSNGTVAAMILCDLVAGKDNPWADLYNSMRTRPIKSIPRAVVQHIKG